MAIQSDPLHLFMRAWRSTSIAEMVMESKGLTSHELGKEYRILKRLPSHWMWAYFTANESGVSVEAI